MGVLGAGAGSQGPLPPRACGSQFFLAFAAEYLLEAPVSGFGLGDRDLALDLYGSNLLQRPVHRRIDPADEEGGHRGYPVELAFPGQTDKPRQRFRTGLTRKSG